MSHFPDKRYQDELMSQGKGIAAPHRPPWANRPSARPFMGSDQNPAEAPIYVAQFNSTAQIVGGFRRFQNRFKSCNISIIRVLI